MSVEDSTESSETDEPQTGQMTLGFLLGASAIFGDTETIGVGADAYALIAVEMSVYRKGIFIIRYPSNFGVVAAADMSDHFGFDLDVDVSGVIVFKELEEFGKLVTTDVGIEGLGGKVFFDPDTGMPVGGGAGINVSGTGGGGVAASGPDETLNITVKSISKAVYDWWQDRFGD